nr:VanZ family protein [Ectobacillus panaciterrae]
MNEQQDEHTLSDVKVTYAGSEVSPKRMGGVGFLEFFMRKGAHFAMYALLGLFVDRAFRSFAKSHCFAWSFIFVFLYAISDEFHQFITGGCTPLYQDVMIDTAEGITGILMQILMKRRA